MARNGPGRKVGRKMKEEMHAKENKKLILWLKAHGHTDTEVVDCLLSLAEDEPKKEAKKKKPVTQPSKAK